MFIEINISVMYAAKKLDGMGMGKLIIFLC